MAIPDFYSIMLPLLQEISDGNEHYIKDIIERLANRFKLTPEERTKLLPSGQNFIFTNRVCFARTYLYKAGLLDVPKRGFLKITKRGKEVLNQNLDKIDINFLKQFEEFRKFYEYKKTKDFEGTLVTEIEENLSPEEKMENAHIEYNKTLISELLDLINKLPPQTFEKLVVDILVKMGYGGSIEDAAQVIGGSRDEGIDGVIKQDPLGLDVVYIQAKRWDSNIGRQELQKFVGALQGKHSLKGVFITTSNFTKEAIEYVEKVGGSKIILINGETLAKMMIKYNVGVTTKKNFELKEIDRDYFEE